MPRVPLEDALHWLDRAALKGGMAVLVLLLAWLASRTLRRLIRRLEGTGHLTPTMAQRLHSGRRWILWSLAGLTALQLTGLFAHAWALLSALVAAIAVGFVATWSILSNATCAVFILTFRPFRLGDQVELVEPTNGTRMAGAVVDMNLMYTTLHERDADSGAVHVLHIPNNLFMQKLVRVSGEAATPPGEPFFRHSVDDSGGQR